MSTHDDQPEASGRNPDNGLFEPYTPNWPSSPGLSEPGATASHNEDFFGNANETTFLPGVTAPPARLIDAEDSRSLPASARWHGGADLGLLVLRLAVGGVFLLHGLQHLVGLFHGIGIDAFGDLLRSYGYHYPAILNLVVGWAELAGGGLLILGLFTPAAAAAVLAVAVNVIVVKWHLGVAAPEIEFEAVLAASSFALLFTRPGRISLDLPTPWYRHPVVSGWICLLLAAAATVTVLLKLR